MLNKGFFLKINTLTLGSVLVLILVGSIVRSTGAGMGCPDWPKCFGSYIPPTSVSQLPENYLDIFKGERLQKNERLAAMLSSLGYSNLSYKILNDPFIQQEQGFNVTKAWIEYVNRLVGVLIGLFVFANMVLAFVTHQSRSVLIVGVLVFLLTGFQGWVGSLVVSTNLLHGFITFHMLVALLIVALLLWTNVNVRSLPKIQSKLTFYLVLVLFTLFIPQIILGTEVRGVVDMLLISEPDRANWTRSLTSIFLYHRSYSWTFLIGSLVLLNIVRKKGLGEIVLASKLLLIMIGSIALVGVAMTKLDFPVWSQPLHLIFATGIFSVLFYLILRLKPV